MKLEEAIKVNQSLLDGTYDHRDETMEEALRLCIEAGKFVEDARQITVPYLARLLSGETKD